MARTVYWVVPSGGDWNVQRQGSDAALASFANKDDAVDERVRRCKAEEPSQLKVMTRDGKIEYERTYGNDPERYPG